MRAPSSFFCTLKRQEGFDAPSEVGEGGGGLLQDPRSAASLELQRMEEERGLRGPCWFCHKGGVICIFEVRGCLLFENWFSAI